MRTESVAEFMARRRCLESLACPSDKDVPFFNEHIELANEHGMEYQERSSS